MYTMEYNSARKNDSAISSNTWMDLEINYHAEWSESDR